MAGDHVQLVQELVSTARQAIRGPQEIESSDEFVDVVSLVRRNFSRVQRTTDDEGRHRGRKKRIEWKTKIFLLRRSNPDFFPSPAECRFLTRNGFGEATVDESNVISVLRTWDLGRLEAHITSLFPGVPLSLVGFTYARCDKGRRVRKIAPQSLPDLERQIGKAKMIIVPNRDIPLNETDQQGPTFPEIARQAPSSRETEQQAPSSPEIENQAPSSPEIENQAPSSPEVENQALSSPQPSLETQEIGWTTGGTPTVQFRTTAEGEHDSAVSVEVAAHLHHALSALESLLDLEERQMTVSRSDVVEPMLQRYKDDPSILQSRLHVSFAGESGDDFGGLSKDMFTTFWTSAFDSLFIGDRCKVPSLPFHRVRKELWKYESIGSILTHSVALTKCLPSMIARTSIISIVFASEVDRQCLLEDFLLFCTRAEQHLLQKAMAQFRSLDAKEMDSLITFFSINGYLGMPNCQEIADQVVEIAQKVLLDTPRPLYDAMRRGIPDSHLSSFWAQLTIEEISALITSQRPTPIKVVDCLVTEAEYIRPEEEKVLYFLKQFVRGLDQEDLLSFLHFVTGSIHMPDGGIKISFTKLAGELRRPIVHTCSNLMELSVMYSSFHEFRRELTQYLRSELAFQFSIM